MARKSSRSTPKKRSADYAELSDESDFSEISSVLSSSDDFEEPSPVKKKKDNSKKDSNSQKKDNSNNKKAATPISKKSRTASPATSKSANNNPVKSVPTSSIAESVPNGISSNGEASNSNLAVSWKGAAVASEAGARKLIQQYMLSQNRPYSVIQVYDNLHHRVGKTVVQRTLDLLCGEGQCLMFKDYGKARIYFPDQTKLQSDFTSEDLARLDDESKSLENVLKSLRQSEAQLQADRKAAENELPDKALDGVLENERSKLEELQRRVALFSGEGREIITPQARAKTMADYKKYRNAWRDRKAKARDLIDMMADGMEKTEKFVMDLVGIETDEEFGAKLPPSLS